MTSTLRPYTPSRESAADLDARTVGRDGVLAAVHQRLRAAATTKNRPHTLLVGPRGAGKSHVLEVALHRLRHDAALVDRLAVAKVAEDVVGLASYADLLVELLRSLAPSAPLLRQPSARRDPVAVERAIEEELGERVLVAVVENLDRLFTAMGTLGQQQFRAWVETSGAVVLLASSPLLFQAVGSRQEPWFGSFAVEHLDDLDLAQGRVLLRQLARARGDTALTALLDSEKGEARLAALHALSGGSPRVWVILGDCASVTGLDELVPTVERLLEDLVPYYQQRLWELPANEQRLVTELGRGPEQATVKELAAATGLNETTAGKTLNRLADVRWVRAEKRPGTDQRATWYRLREPMLRHHFQYRSTEGGPLRLLVLVLRIWFDPHERRRFLAGAPARSRAEEHLAATFSLDPPRRADSGYASHDIDELLAEARLWAVGDGIGDPRSGAVLEVLIESARNGPEAATRLAAVRGVAEDPLVAPALTAGPSDDEADPDDTLRCLLSAAADAVSEGEPAAALGLVAAGWSGASDPAAAVHRLRRLATSQETPLMLTIRDELAYWLYESNRPEEGLAAVESVLTARLHLLGADHPDTLHSRHNHADLIGEVGRVGEAAELLAEVAADRVRVLGLDHSDTLRSRHSHAHWVGTSGRWGEAAALLAEVAADHVRVLGADHSDTLRSRHNHAHCVGKSGGAGEAAALFAEVAADRVRVLGADHPDTLSSRHEHATWMGQSGRWDEAAALFAVVAADRVGVLGADHPETLGSRHNHAFSLWAAGSADEGISLLRGVVADRARVLGPEHPDTLTSQWCLAYAHARSGRVAEALAVCRDMLSESAGSSEEKVAAVLLVVLRKVLAGVAAERRQAVEADIASVASVAISVLRGEAGADHLPPELRSAFEPAIGGAAGA